VLVPQVGPLLFLRWVISNLAQKFSFVTNRFDLIRRRRWLISALGSNVVRTLGFKDQLITINPEKGFAAGGTLTGFNAHVIDAYPGFSLRSNPGLELANASGVFPLAKLFSTSFGENFEVIYVLRPATRG
jgi:hypothetical protein